MTVGGGLFRSVCQECDAVRLEVTEQTAVPNDLFRTKQRHDLFSPLVEFAAIYGHELIAKAQFGRRRAPPRVPALSGV